MGKSKLSFGNRVQTATVPAKSAAFAVAFSILDGLRRAYHFFSVKKKENAEAATNNRVEEGTSRWVDVPNVDEYESASDKDKDEAHTKLKQCADTPTEIYVDSETNRPTQEIVQKFEEVSTAARQVGVAETHVLSLSNTKTAEATKNNSEIALYTPLTTNKTDKQEYTVSRLGLRTKKLYTFLKENVDQETGRLLDEEQQSKVDNHVQKISDYIKQLTEQGKEEQGKDEKYVWWGAEEVFESDTAQSPINLRSSVNDNETKKRRLYSIEGTKRWYRYDLGSTNKLFLNNTGGDTTTVVLRRRDPVKVIANIHQVLTTTLESENYKEAIQMMEDLKIGTPAHLNKKESGKTSTSEITGDEALSVRAMARTAVHNVTNKSSISSLQTPELCAAQLKEVEGLISATKKRVEKINRPTPDCKLTQKEEAKLQARYMNAFEMLINTVSCYETWQSRWSEEKRPKNWTEISEKLRELQTSFTQKGDEVTSQRGEKSDGHGGQCLESMPDSDKFFILTDLEPFRTPDLAKQKQKTRRKILNSIAKDYAVRFQHPDAPCSYTLQRGVYSNNSGRHIARFKFDGDEMLQLIKAVVPKWCEPLTRTTNPTS